MAYRLKSRTQAPPDGFLFHQKQTGWRSWIVDPVTQWDFNKLCIALRNHRLANPRYKFSTNMALIQNEVDCENAKRVAAIPNADIYVVQDPSAASFRPAPAQTNPLRQVVAAVAKVSAGASAIEDFLESGEPPVAQDVAERRASVCVNCPKNEPGDLTRFFTVPASEAIRKQLERAHQLKLHTQSDTQINVCSACLCPLRLKVWFPISFIVKHMTDDVKAELQPESPRCWILEEAK